MAAEKGRSAGKVTAVVALSLLGLAGLTALAYWRDISAARRRASAGSQLLQTSSGVIEYAELGSGTPLLSVHGTGGGFDHGLLQAEMFGIDPARFRIISPSRFGYLRTPLPEGQPSPADEACAHAALLDALGITEPVVLMGVSAGALSVEQFALQYPERVKALLLIVPAGWVRSSDSQAQEIGENKFILNTVLSSDFLLWVLLKVGRRQMLEFVGVPADQQRSLSPEDARNVRAIVDGILPASRRFEGIMKDDRNQHALSAFPVQDIAAPTLIIDAADVGTFANSQHLAAAIPGAEFVQFSSGGHLLLGHGEEVRESVAEFLERLD